MLIEETDFTDDDLAVLDTQCNLTSGDIGAMEKKHRCRIKMAILLHIGCIDGEITNSRHNLHGVVQEIRAA